MAAGCADALHRHGGFICIGWLSEATVTPAPTPSALAFRAVCGALAPPPSYAHGRRSLAANRMCGRWALWRPSAASCQTRFRARLERCGEAQECSLNLTTGMLTKVVAGPFCGTDRPQAIDCFDWCLEWLLWKAGLGQDSPRLIKCRRCSQCGRQQLLSTPSSILTPLCCRHTERRPTLSPRLSWCPEERKAQSV
eukprot:363324-Chlamydomonas_euryale.AAC.22